MWRQSNWSRSLATTSRRTWQREDRRNGFPLSDRCRDSLLQHRARMSIRTIRTRKIRVLLDGSPYSGGNRSLSTGANLQEKRRWCSRSPSANDTCLPEIWHWRQVQTWHQDTSRRRSVSSLCTIKINYVHSRTRSQFCQRSQNTHQSRSPQGGKRKRLDTEYPEGCDLQRMAAST